jgi:tetratricopeptide (TPR) repeat protein
VKVAAASPAATLLAAARAAMARKDAHAAQQAFATLLQIYPDYAHGWLAASIFELDLCHPSRALKAAERALTLGLADPALRVQHVRCLHQAGRSAQARDALVAAEPALAGHPDLQHELGNAAAALGAHEDALRLMQQAYCALPENPALAYNMAAVLRYLGRFEEAEAALDTALRQAPHDYAAHLARSQLRTQTPDRNHIDSLQHVLDSRSADWSGEVQIRYALAKELEDLGRFDDSFVHLQAGASLRRRHLRYDVAGDIEAMASIAAHFDADYMAGAAAGRAERGPIFVFGLPRSGTTLIDRILSSHPDVESLGELNDFPASVIAAAGQNGTPKQDLIHRAAGISPGDIGALYLARTQAMPRTKPIFIDKLPMNYLYAGLIAAALPNARLVHVTRHPNGYGMYKVLFDQGYPFSYDLDELGRYMAAYMRLMSHWRHVLAGRLIQVDYENLVSDQEGATRRLVAACGLPWAEACLAPHRNTSASATQSAVQVRQPIHPAAVRHWQHVAPWLHGLHERLVADGVPEVMLT